MKRYLIIGAALCSQPAAAQEMNFRGLNGQSTRQDALKAFPAALVLDACSAGEKELRSAEGSTDCKQMELPVYELDGKKFELTILFSLGGNVRHISLLQSVGRPSTGEGNVDRGALSSAFVSLADLVSSKYGASVSDMQSCRSTPANAVCYKREWQPGRGSFWKPGGDRIFLEVSGREGRLTPQKFWGSIHLFYTFAKTAEFERF